MVKRGALPPVPPGVFKEENREVFFSRRPGPRGCLLVRLAGRAALPPPLGGLEYGLDDFDDHGPGDCRRDCLEKLPELVEHLLAFQAVQWARLSGCSGHNEFNSISFLRLSSGLSNPLFP